MNYNKKTVCDVNVSGKKVLLRCDFNVPQDKETEEEPAAVAKLCLAIVPGRFGGGKPQVNPAVAAEKLVKVGVDGEVHHGPVVKARPLHRPVADVEAQGLNEPRRSARAMARRSMQRSFMLPSSRVRVEVPTLTTSFFVPLSVIFSSFLACVGQCELMFMYDKFFSEYGQKIGQLLVTKDDFENETRRLNLENTFEKLFFPLSFRRRKAAAYL